jgi:hypothetical protein
MENESGDAVGVVPKGEGAVWASGMAMFGGEAHVPTAMLLICATSTEEVKWDRQYDQGRNMI